MQGAAWVSAMSLVSQAVIVRPLQPPYQLDEVDHFHERAFFGMREFNKLFVISLPRCATVSISQALGHLGIRVAHLGKIYGEPGSDHHHTGRLQQMLAQIQTGDFHFDLLDHCDGLADYPACCLNVVEQLIQAYPDSLFVNVQRQRSITQWLQSVESQFVGLELLQQVQETTPEHQQFVEVMKQFREMTFGSRSFEAEIYRQAYLDYQQQIDRLFHKSEQLLNIEDVSQLAELGFPRLCKFLEIEPVPTTSFPRSNDHSSRPRQAFIDGLRAGRVVSQTGVSIERKEC